MDLRRVRHLAGPGMASMWQTLLNLLTFHRDFASQAASGGSALAPGAGWRPSGSTRWSPCWRLMPTASLAVLLETGAVIARHGGVIEIEAEPLPPTS